MSDRKKSFEDRVNEIPGLRERFEAILTIAEAEGNELKKADDAEQRTIDEVRKLGNEVLHAWARKREEHTVSQLTQKESKVTGHGKKKSTGIRRSER